MHTFVLPEITGKLDIGPDGNVTLEVESEKTGAFETGFGGYAPRDEDGTPWQLPHDVETHSSVAGYLGGPCDPTASPALLC